MSYTPLDGRRIGMLTPSSNTVLEPYASAMLAVWRCRQRPFRTVPVVEISMSEASQAQFAVEPILDAAERWARPIRI